MTARWKIVVAYLTLCIVWSSTWLAIKWGLTDLPPVSYAAIRFLVAVVLLVLVSVGRVRLLPRSGTEWLLLAITGVLMFAVNYGLLFWGELHVSSGLAAVLQATLPVFGLLFAHWLLPSEPLRWRQVIGSFISIGGVALICSRLFGHGGKMAFWGGLGISLGAAGAAFSNVLLKRRALQLAPAMIAAWQMIFGGVPLFLLGLTLEGNPLHFRWSGMAIACLLYLAIIGSALTFLLLYWLLPRIPVNKLQTISLVTPPGAVAIGWILGGETFSLWPLAGGGLVLAGLWMIFTKSAPVTVPTETEAALPT